VNESCVECVTRVVHVHDEDLSGHPSVINKDFKNRINQYIRTNSRFILEFVNGKGPRTTD
jgi:hypothetical protein